MSALGRGHLDLTALYFLALPWTLGGFGHVMKRGFWAVSIIVLLCVLNLCTENDSCSTSVQANIGYFLYSSTAVLKKQVTCISWNEVMVISKEEENTIVFS